MCELLTGKYYGIAQMRDNYYDEYLKVVELNKNFGDISWGQKMYNYVNGLSTLPVCKCGNALKFLKFGRGYYSYCSNECRYKDEELKVKNKQNYFEKHGVENPLQLAVVQEKRRKLFQEKYGVDHQSQLDSVKEKKQQTYIERFGAVTNLLCKETKDKITETNLKKFGVEHNSQSVEIKEKKKQTNLENCGYEYNFQSTEFLSNSKTIQDKKYLLKISKLLNIDIHNLEIADKTIIINNYCEKHESFEISKHNLYSRFISYKHDKFCTKCFPISECDSLRGKDLQYFIDDLHVENVRNTRKIISPLELDVYVESHNLGIEFDGLYWHSNAGKSTDYHLNKTELCEQQGIQLIHIFEDEWLNKNEIVKSILKSKLGIIDNKIFARKCVVREIDGNTSQTFLNNNHIQGNVNAKIKIGLFYNNELVSLMTFGNKRLVMGNKINVDGEYEMLRFCNKLNTSVIGGASRLLSYFIKTYKPVSILTFADRRYSQGNLYKQLGFHFIKNTKPNYWYFEKNEMIRHHRFNYRKDVLVREGFDPNKTEHEIMSERGFLCIYDCGNMKFTLNL